MSTKRLHIHSLPLFSFAVAATTVTMLAAMAYGSGMSFGGWLALVRPGVRLEAGQHGYAKVVPNKMPTEEPAGAHIQPPETEVEDTGISHILELSKPVGVKLVLQAADD